MSEACDQFAMRATVVTFQLIKLGLRWLKTPEVAEGKQWPEEMELTSYDVTSRQKKIFLNVKSA